MIPLKKKIINWVEKRKTSFNTISFLKKKKMGSPQTKRNIHEECSQYFEYSNLYFVHQTWITPKLNFFSIGAWLAASIPIEIQVRVSNGSIIPSVQSRAAA